MLVLFVNFTKVSPFFMVTGRLRLHYLPVNISLQIIEKLDDLSPRRQTFSQGI